MVKTIEQYLQSNPDASLKEYQDYVKEQTRIDSNNAFETLRKCHEWYAQLANRYFMINFNGTSFRMVYIDKPMKYKSGERYLTYCIILDDETCSIERTSMYLNPEWFACPYDLSSGKGVEEVREMTKDEYDTIILQYQKINKLFNEMKLK